MNRTILILGLLMAASLELRAQGPDILYLRFNEGSGSTTADLALPGVGATPTLVGACGWATNGIVGTTCLQPGAGANDSVDVGVGLNVTGDWTLEFWERDTFVSPISPLLARHIMSDGTNNGFSIYHKNILGFPNHDLVFVPSAGNPMTVAQSIVPNTWVHFAFVYTNSNKTITAYVNGVQVTTQVYGLAVPLLTTAGTNLRVGGYVNGASWAGEIDEVRIWGSARSAVDINANYNQEVALFANNVAVVAVTAPSTPSGACVLAGSAETVTCTVANASGTAIAGNSLIPIEYVLDGGAPVPDLVSVPAAGLAAGGTLSHSFGTLADLSASGSHLITVTVGQPGDQYAADDSASVTVISGGEGRVQAFPWVENFDGRNSGSTNPPLGWEQETGDSSGANSDWIFLQGQAGTVTTSPLGDHTSGNGIYAYVEDSSAELANVSLRTPCLDLGGLSMPRLAFWFHSQDASGGLNTNPMSIDVIVQPGGTVTMDVFGPEGNIGNGWMPRSVDLSAFAGQTVQLIFRGRSDGGTAKNDTAIDDVSVFQGALTNGQAPVPGTAVLDLNAAINGAGLPVSTAANGPYFVSSGAGQTLLFGYEGELNRPFSLLIGPLNPVAATFPNVGQLDIGGAVDPMTGIPAFIQVLGDGFNPVDFFDVLFNTGPTGSTTMSFPTPAIPAGVIGAFQVVYSTGNGFFFALSNAVELTII